MQRALFSGRRKEEKCNIKGKIAIVLRHKKGGDSVSRWRNNGGWNRTHGQVERVPRVDSFEAGEIDGCGALFGYTDGGIPLVLDCCHNTGCAPDGEWENLEIWHPKDGWSQILELSRKANGYGGSQAFFLCPNCGERRRYLYQVGATFLCRKCARLNYKSQQETRSGTLYWYEKGCTLVEKHLDTWPRVRPNGFDFCAWIPERPRYMHRSTYLKYLRRFAKYQHHHQIRELEDMMKILRIFK